MHSYITASDEELGPAGGGAVAWFAVIVLCIAQIVSTIDRGMLALAIDPVRHDLAISEIQIALLQGFAFSVFYVTIGLPLGAVADVVNRKRLLIAGIIVWSAATIGGGLAHDFGHMFASRVFIGVGEAVLGPCAVTMISDMFPPSKRGRPLAVYILGSMVAYGVGSLVSGYILQIAPLGAFDGISFLAGRAPWRIVFILVGSFGFVIAALLACLSEPLRRGAVAGVKGTTAIRASLRHFAAERRILLPLYGMLALFAMGGSAATGWGAVLLTRSFGFQISDAGKGLGLGQIAWAVVGAGVASIVVDRVSRSGGAVSKVKLSAALCLAAVPSVVAGLVPNGTLAVVLLSEIMFASAVFGTTMLSVISQVTPSGARGLAVALYAFVMTMIGGSLGPLAVAYLTQHVFGAPEAVGTSMAIVGVASLALAALLGLLTARRMYASNSAPERWIVSSALPA